MKRTHSRTTALNVSFPGITDHQELLIEELGRPHHEVQYHPTAAQGQALRALALVRESSPLAELRVLHRALDAVDSEQKDGCIDSLLSVCHNNGWPLNFVHLAKRFGTTAFPGEYNCPNGALIAYVLRNCQQIVDYYLDEFGSFRDLDNVLMALRETSHLKRFSLEFEGDSDAVGTMTAYALQSHHHLESLDLGPPDDPGRFVPELLKGLAAWSDSLQTLCLSPHQAWTKEMLADVGNGLRQIRTLSSLSLKFETSCDMSPFIDALADANHPPAQLRDLDLRCNDRDRPRAHTEAIAGALVVAIGRLPNLQTLIVDEAVFDVISNDPNLIPMVKKNGIFSSLRTSDVLSDPLPNSLAQQLEKNRNQVSERLPEMFQAASEVFMSTIATTCFHKVADLGKVVTAYALGANTPADRRACQNLLFVSKDVWEAARNVRFNASENLINNKLRSRAPAYLTYQP